MNFDIDGNVLSGFIPPTDENGKFLSYEEWRISVGVPMIQAEHDAIDKCNEAMDIKDYKSYKIHEAKRAIAEDEAFRIADRCKNTDCINGYSCDGSHQTMEPWQPIYCGGEIMNFDIDGNVLSGFIPPTDENGKFLSYGRMGQGDARASAATYARCRTSDRCSDVGQVMTTQEKQRVVELLLCAVDSIESGTVQHYTPMGDAAIGLGYDWENPWMTGIEAQFAMNMISLANNGFGWGCADDRVSLGLEVAYWLIENDPDLTQEWFGK